MESLDQKNYGLKLKSKFQSNKIVNVIFVNPQKKLTIVRRNLKNIYVLFVTINNIIKRKQIKI
uniref:Uncharacterized protein n=1 Tax=Meloidogyne enterolobii TaxID=390850 RepID=A0A6V7VFR8_MELEN|nr:unnamed protein product [Meloidogyne enterolobii]